MIAQTAPIADGILLGLYALAALVWLVWIIDRQGPWRVLAWAVSAGGVGLHAAVFALRWLGADASPPLATLADALAASAWLGLGLASLGELRLRRGWLGMAASFWAAGVMGALLAWPGVFAPGGPPPAILRSGMLGVHVGVIILGHAAAAMAFVLSSIQLVGSAVSGLPEPPRGKSPFGPGPLDHCNQRAVRLALLLISAGTVLGSVWADVAWGRYWGWDPKETWALITIALLAAALLARSAAGPRAKPVVLSALAVLAFSAALFNMLGVNLLLPGLHSYAR
jgi:ABC-type transport system involved in cytochrome c biogenesis permease subunit